MIFQGHRVHPAPEGPGGEGVPQEEAFSEWGEGGGPGQGPLLPALQAHGARPPRQVQA